MKRTYDTYWTYYNSSCQKLSEQIDSALKTVISPIGNLNCNKYVLFQAFQKHKTDNIGHQQLKYFIAKVAIKWNIIGIWLGGICFFLSLPFLLPAPYILQHHKIIIKHIFLQTNLQVEYVTGKQNIYIYIQVNSCFYCINTFPFTLQKDCTSCCYSFGVLF